MEFFGIGAPELMVILVIAIVLFGPDKIPTMAAQVGKTIREFRRYTSELTKEFDAATGDLRQEFHTIAGDLRGELEATQADLRSQLDLTDVFKADAPKEAVAASIAASEPATEVLAAGSAEPAVAAVTTAPEPVETITVTTPYAEALAVASNGAVTAAPAGESIAAPVATKADPFADLASLVVDQPSDAPVTIVAADPAATSAGAGPSPGSVAELDASTVATNGKPKIVGGSVTGSKYSRRKSR